MNNNNIVSNQYGDINIVDRKKISLTGVKRLVSFNPEEFLIETLLGVLMLKGQNLEIIKLDTTDGVLSIKGKIDDLSYMESSKKNQMGIISRLFR